MEPWRAAQTDVDALLAARHGDPFAVLGPHPVQDGFVLRALIPGAEEVTTADGHVLSCRDPAGFFEQKLPRAPLPGHVLHARRNQDRWTVTDPYAFAPALGTLDDHLLLEGTHARLHERLGAHAVMHQGVHGVRFAVWAPNARRVSVVGGFNAWDGRVHPMRRRIDSGIWEIFLPDVKVGAAYKYELVGPDGQVLPLKADPFAFAAELRPATASVVADPAPFAWSDQAWMAARAEREARNAPLAIYEVHAPSWKRHPDGRLWNWDELAADLIPYVAGLGFTHVELMPVMEHPLDASWGYQPIGMFAPTARLGGPVGLKRFIDAAHRAGLGVILDWVPAHFPQDAHGLARFDGTTLYENPDPRRGFLPGWGTGAYDYGRAEVRAFLCSNALYWLEHFHADGLRVDAVSSMLYLDYGRGPGEWAPNEDGSNHNRDAVAFLRQVNALVQAEHPGALMMAEEATAWQGVSRPVGQGGLGFAFKWNMGWMNDTLRYVAKDPVHRRWHHALMNFGPMYAWNEDFVLPLSHDEVVHGKGTLLGRMPGDDWQRFANLRCYLAFMWGHPGKKLLFMGGELGQWREWSEARELDWWLLAHAPHQAIQRLVRDLNRLHRGWPALHAADCTPAGFQWIDADDADHSTFAWLRHDGTGGSPVAILCNFTPVVRTRRIGLPAAGAWRELLNTDARDYGGSGVGNAGRVPAVAEPSHSLPASALVTLPPLGAIFLAPGKDGQAGEETADA